MSLTVPVLMGAEWPVDRGRVDSGERDVNDPRSIDFRSVGL